MYKFGKKIPSEEKSACLVDPSLYVVTMYESNPTDRRLLGDDAQRDLTNRQNVIVYEDAVKQKQVTVIERNHCCQGFGRKFTSEDRTVFLILSGVILMSLAYFFLRVHKHEIKTIL